jgi:hypothetical protein
MRKFLHNPVAILIIAALLLSACKSSQATPEIDLQAQITQTMQAVATDVQATLQAAVPTAAPATNTPLPTDTPLPTEPPPTETPVPAITETSAPTAAPAINAVARMVQNTNCRSGPATSFPLVFVAQQGESLKIISGTTVEKYVIVENPTTPGQSCWLWTEFVEVQGDLTGLPVVTPPPTPTSSMRYAISYVRIDACTGWSVVFKATNTGSSTMESYSIVTTDQTANNTETTVLNHFSDRVACKYQEEIANLKPGQSGYIYENDFSYNPDDHSLLVYITVCSNNDLQGVCESQGFLITP